MTPEQRARADTLLAEALDRPATEREAFLKEACGGDAELQRLVLALLRDAEGDDDFLRPGQVLEGPLWQRASDALAGARVEPGTVFGAWEVVRALGSGGMA